MLLDLYLRDLPLVRILVGLLVAVVRKAVTKTTTSMTREVAQGLMAGVAFAVMFILVAFLMILGVTARTPGLVLAKAVCFLLGRLLELRLIAWSFVLEVMILLSEFVVLSFGLELELQVDGAQLTLAGMALVLEGLHCTSMSARTFHFIMVVCISEAVVLEVMFVLYTFVVLSFGLELALGVEVCLLTFVETALVLEVLLFNFGSAQVFHVITVVWFAEAVVILVVILLNVFGKLSCGLALYLQLDGDLLTLAEMESVLEDLQFQFVNVRTFQFISVVCIPEAVVLVPLFLVELRVPVVPSFVAKIVPAFLLLMATIVPSFLLLIIRISLRLLHSGAGLLMCQQRGFLFLRFPSFFSGLFTLFLETLIASAMSVYRVCQTSLFLASLRERGLPSAA